MSVKSFRDGSQWPIFSSAPEEDAIDWLCQIFDLTSYFQDGGHDVIYAEKCCHLMSVHAASALHPLREPAAAY